MRHRATFGESALGVIDYDSDSDTDTDTDTDSDDETGDPFASISRAPAI